MGKQLRGALIMFVAISLLPLIQFADVDTQGLDTLRMILLFLIRGAGFVLLFSTFFVGLKVFSAGLAQERADNTRPPG
jgi:hypothetical protein